MDTLWFYYHVLHLTKLEIGNFDAADTFDLQQVLDLSDFSKKDLSLRRDIRRFRTSQCHVCWSTCAHPYTHTHTHTHMSCGLSNERADALTNVGCLCHNPKVDTIL